jgi:hypothetical protein
MVCVLQELSCDSLHKERFQAIMSSDGDPDLDEDFQEHGYFDLSNLGSFQLLRQNFGPGTQPYLPTLSFGRPNTGGARAQRAGKHLLRITRFTCTTSSSSARV